MGTPNSLLYVSVWELENSLHPGDKEIAQKCYEVLGRTMELIKPILRYVCVPMDFLKEASLPIENWVRLHCLEICGYNDIGVERTRCNLILDHRGVFARSIVVVGGKGARAISEFSLGDYWRFAPFDEVIQRLQAVLVEAEDNRRKHLKALTSRRQILDEMLAVLAKQPVVE